MVARVLEILGVSEVPIGKAAKILGITTGALSSRCNRGTVPYHYNGERRYFRVIDLLKMIEQ